MLCVLAAIFTFFVWRYSILAPERSVGNQKHARRRKLSQAMLRDTWFDCRMLNDFLAIFFFVQMWNPRKCSRLKALLKQHKCFCETVFQARQIHEVFLLLRQTSSTFGISYLECKFGLSFFTCLGGVASSLDGDRINISRNYHN